MQLTFLGTGTSAGVPLIGCHCEVCTSTNLKDKRLRSSVWISDDDTSIVIDTGPDFRSQMLQYGVEKLDAVVFTHEHRDHIAGLDDTRPYFFWSGKPMQIFCESAVEKAIKRDFYYAFQENPYPGSPQFDLHQIEENKSFKVGGIEILPLRVIHGELPVLGFKIKELAYITDANALSAETEKAIDGCDILILNALRIEGHHSHYNLEEAIAVAEKSRAKKVYFTHVSHQLGTTESVEKLLPKNMSLAYDGQVIQF
ncbi:MBL fold metallo-hydrolase [Luteibaculum oceani]|uniref:MBL fold metallo-hydrolase n=1 Tax=Luteibaculum oceani TaxID=1294296 RepID=A0A5C6V0F6_9FLAO|nr:MBL fold metallo-hydrolase [Luteibaculum oceani]TXC78659.1 MBL fold metallo-hydrolase [Luteibaculum oceani]